MMAPKKALNPILVKTIATVLATMISAVVFAGFNLEKRISDLEYEGKSSREILITMDKKISHILCKNGESSYCKN